jgi:proteasome lid subunit RPN8/RPN11
VVRHALAELPRECCGLLLGAADDVLEAVPSANLSPDPNRFLIDPAAHFSARREARRRGLSIVGFYHSHPHSPAQPSPTDTAEASYDDHLYLIVGLCTDPPELRLFRNEHMNFVQVEFVTGS